MYPNKKTLAPSISLSAFQTDKFKTETLSVSLVTPIDKERSPLSLLVLSILKRGCEKYTTQGALNLRLDELYAASVSVRSHRCGNANILGFAAEMLCREYTDGKTDILGGVLEVLSQILFYPLTDKKGYFYDAYIQSEKNNQCDSIEAQINNPRAYALKRCHEIMFSEDCYGVGLLGTTNQVKAITADELLSCYRDLISNYRYEFFYVGPRTIGEVEEKLRTAFIPHITTKDCIQVSQKAVSRKVSEIRRVTETMPISQGKLVIGFRTDIDIHSPKFYAMLVMNEIFGWSPISKLFMNVRERLGLCYYCSSVYDIFKGCIMVSCGISPQNKQKAEEEIFNQLSQIVSGNVTNDELDAAKHSLCNSYRALSDSPSLLESYYFSRNEYGVNCSVEECIENIRRVSLKDVIGVAAEVKPDTVYFLDGNGEGGENDNE